MNTLDNAKVILALETLTVSHYLLNLVQSPMHKITLFSVFPYSGTPNLSDPRYLVLMDDLSKVAALNSGCYHN